MLEKDRFLEKTSHLIFLIFIFFSKVLVAETTLSKIFNYNKNLINSSALFIQNDGIKIQLRLYLIEISVQFGLKI